MKRVIILFSILLGLWGCSENSSSSDGNPTGNGNSDGDSDGDSDSDADSDSDGDSDVDTDVDTDADGDGDSETGYSTDLVEWSGDGGECAGWDLRINLEPARLMLLQDVSSSMSDGTSNGSPSKWEQARNALISLVNNYGFSDLLEIGFDVFPDRRDCHPEEPIVLDAAPENGQNIYNVLSRLELSQSTPLFMAMQNFLDTDYAPVFSQQDLDHYLVIVSDGMDTCGSEPGGSPNDSNGATAQQLGSMAKQLLETHGIMTIAIGFGSAADPEQLNAIASNGGTPYDNYFVAGNREELETVFSEIAAFAINCQFEIDLEQTDVEDGEELDMDKVNFFFDEEVVGLDEGCEAGTGWDWVDPTVRDTVEFCEQACEQIKNGDVTDISAEFGCKSAKVIVVK